MGQHIVSVINNIPGLFLKKVGSHHAGAKWSVDNVPEILIEKAKAKETGKNAKGNIVPICSFITAEGSIVGIEQAYIPRFKIGTPPPPLVEFQSKKSRNAVSAPEPEVDTTKPEDEDKLEDDNSTLLNNGESEEDEKEENEESSDESENETEATEEESSPKKKKKKLKRIGQ